MKRALPWAALAVLALACALRWDGLARWPIDGDELYSLFDVREILAGRSWPEGVKSHPLGYLGMAGAVALFGEGEGALRLFAALTGAAAVAALLFIRRDAVPRAVAFVAGSAAAASPWLLFHAQEARFYGPLLLCATLATLWALPGPGRRPVSAACAALAAMLCHPSAWLLVPCLLWPALVSRPARVRWALVVGAIVGLGLVLLLAGTAVVDVVQAALTRRATAHYDALHLVAGLGYNVGPGVGLLAAIGALAAWRTRTEGDLQLLLSACLPPFVLLLGAFAGVSMQQRYAMASVPAMLLLAGRGLVPLAQPRPALWGGALLAALLPGLPWLIDYRSQGDRSDFRAAAAWIDEHAGPEDNIVADEHLLLDLYLREEGALADRSLIEAPAPAQKLWTLARHRHDCWVVVKRSRLPVAYGEDFKAWLDQHFIERARIGSDPPPLVRHDNQLLILQRRERVLEKPR